VFSSPTYKGGGLNTGLYTMEIRDNRQKEWFWLDNEYLNGYAKHLGVSCTVVYISLCRHADNKSQTCFPSMKLIAEENAISTRTIVRATAILEEWGIIKITKSKKDDGTQANNIYTLLAKSMWKPKPSDIKSHGYRVTENDDPSDIKDENRVTTETHNNTHINNTQLTTLKQSCGEFDNVKLTEVEKQKLVTLLGENNTKILIEELSSYMASTGKRYSSHYATLLNWSRRKYQKKQENQKKMYVA